MKEHVEYSGVECREEKQCLDSKKFDHRFHSINVNVESRRDMSADVELSFLYCRVC